MSKKEKTVCKNCGQPATFGERASFERVDLGWCSSCFKQSQHDHRYTGKIPVKNRNDFGKKLR